MTAFSDPSNVRMLDIEETGDAFDDPQWRDLLGLNRRAERKHPGHPDQSVHGRRRKPSIDTPKPEAPPVKPTAKPKPVKPPKPPKPEPAEPRRRAPKPAPSRERATQTEPRREPAPKPTPAASGRYEGPSYTVPNGVAKQDVDELRDLMARNAARDLWDRNSGLDWDESARLDELQDNLPVRVVQRIESEIQVQRSFDAFRKELGVDTDPDVLKAEMADRVRETVAGKPIGVRVTEGGLQKILADGRFKTQFETNRSGGRLDVGFRDKIEEINFGLSGRTDPKERPIYGYVLVDGVRPAGADPEGTPGEGDALSQYGRVQVILKPQTRDRSTVMFGDSINNRVAGRPSPINAPTWESFTPASRGGNSRGLSTLDRDVSAPEFRAWQYVEAQVHGGVAIDDIAEVVVPSDPEPATRRALERAGIPWRVLGGDE